MYKIYGFRPALLAVAAGLVFSQPAIGGSVHTEALHTDEHTHAAPGNHARGADPLIEEMLTLDGVFRDVVSGVALSDGHRVHEALEKMHGTMERTHEGVHHGIITLKKNAGRLKDFIEQDKQFHGRLEDLARAAGKNDASSMVSVTQDLLDRCVRCHRDFRQP